MSQTGDLTILVADDNEANRLLAQGTLEDEGYRVILANDGRQAVAAFEREHPSCVLLDVRMPDMDGFAACEQIRSLPHGDETPIIFLTALRDVDTFDHAQRSGGDDFLSKPIRPSELVTRVQSALTLRKLRVELREHYDLLRKQRDDLLRLQLMKERLTAFVVHDLKNPVSAMDLHAQLLLRDKGLSPEAKNSATRIRSEARHLIRMIVNLLDISKADEGNLRPTKKALDLTAIVREVELEIEMNAKVRNVALHIALGVTSIVADEDLLRRVLTNLAENATRHAPTGTTVTITSEREASGILLSVADAGRGIAVDMRERVFDPFVQLEQHEALNRTGRGLGLAFCKRAVEAHGGTISIEDAQPGARFCIRIPQ